MARREYDVVCPFCHVGKCVTHAVRRVVLDLTPVPAELAEVGCCDELARHIESGLVKVSVQTGALFIRGRGECVTISFCPFCGGKKR